MTVHQLVPLFALALNILLLGSALVGPRREQRNVVFGVLAFALAVWNFGVFGLRASADPDVAMLWERVVHVGVIPMPILFYHYVLAFLDQPRRRRSLFLGYGLAALFVAVSSTPLFMRGVVETYWGFAPQSGPLYLPFFVYFQAYMVVGLVHLLRAYRTTATSFRRNRILLVILGVCASLAGGAVDFLRFILHLDRVYPIGIPSNALFAVALGVAVVRYRLWDVGALMKRSVLYSVTVLALVPVAVLGTVLTGWLAPDDRFPSHLVGVLVAFALVALALPVVRGMERWCERLMFARQHGMRDALAALSKDMASILDLQQLGQALTEGLVQRVPVMYAALYRHDGGGDHFPVFARAVSPAMDTPPAGTALDRQLVMWLRLTGRRVSVEDLANQAAVDPSLRALAAELEAARVAVLVPLFMSGELAAILVVGEKVSAEVFDTAEIELLEMLIGQTAVAMKNAGLYGDLQHRMEELRTTQQQQLIQSAKLAAIGELAASVAHELNNPLTVILGTTCLLRRDSTNAPLDTQLALVEEQAMRAGKITRNLLDFARKREPRQEPVNVNVLVPRALELVESKLRRCPVQVETRLTPNLPAMLGDADQLTQVLINLVGNAVDAMPKGGRLVVATDLRGEADCVVLSVSDTGMGISEEQLPHIFEAFYTTKPEGKGTGLGLSVTAGIVKTHSGTIEVDSEPGRGTTIRVCLPLSSVHEPLHETIQA
jgi:two-component system NtrC family sensor kinase